MLSLVNRIATDDGQTFETIDAARNHLLRAVPGFPEDGDSLPNFIISHWKEILEIMTADPGKPKPKPRKRRSDFGTHKPRPAAPMPASQVVDPALTNQMLGLLPQP